MKSSGSISASLCLYKGVQLPTFKKDWLPETNADKQTRNILTVATLRGADGKLVAALAEGVASTINRLANHRQHLGQSRKVHVSKKLQLIWTGILTNWPRSSNRPQMTIQRCIHGWRRPLPQTYYLNKMKKVELLELLILFLKTVNNKSYEIQAWW